MKKIWLYVILPLLLCSEILPSRNQSDFIAKSKIRLGGGVNLGIDYYQYKEPKVMSISGPMLSVDGNFFIGYDVFKFQLDGLFSTYLGANTYEGGLFNATTNQTIPYSTDSEDWYLNIASRFGATFNFSGKEVVFVYGGLGYRFLHNMMVDKPNIKSAYERDQGYLYFLVGVDGEIPVTRIFSFIMALQYRQLVYGHQTSGMKALGYDDDFHFTQSDGLGGRITLGGKFYFPNNMALKVGLYFDYWMIEDSDTVKGTQNGKFVNNFVEPRNHTKVIGINAGITF